MLGTIILKPREAKLYQNAKCPTRTEPYCIAILGNCSIRGVTCKNGGPMARWMDTMIFQFRKEKYCYVEVKDKYILTNDGLLGVCKIDLVNLVTEKGSNRWYDLYLKKRITGQIWIEVLYIDRSHPSQNINNIKENNLRQSREQSALFEKNMQRHFQGNDELVVHSEGNEPRPPSSLQNFELYLNDKKLDSANKQEEINESRKFNTEPHSERMNMVDASIRRVVSPESNKNFRNSQAPTTPSKSQLEVQQEFLVLAKKPRKKSLGRKILDSIKNIFTGKAPQRKKSLQIEPFRRSSFKEPEIVAGCDSNANNVSPIKNGKSDHDQSSISTIKSLVFDQKSDAPLEIPLKEPSPILSEIVMNENKGVHKKKVSFSLNTLGDEDKENTKPPVNQLVKDHVAPVPVLWKSSQKKNEIHETDLNIKDKATHKEINQDSEVKKDGKAEVENDQTNWLEMTKKGFIIIEDLSNNEKRILDVKSSRIDQEIEPIRTTPRTVKVNTYKTENCNEGLNRRSRRFR